MKPLVAHFVNDNLTGPREPGQLYSYYLAGNGVFVAAARESLSAVVPVSVCDVRGLPPLEAGAYLHLPKVPSGALSRMMEIARSSQVGGQPAECLFHLWWEAPKWQLTVPPQERGPGHVIPLESGEGSSYERALIEVHSHHGMKPFWSGTDDREEQGFRLYGVIGDVFRRPLLRLRVGVYGNFMELDPSDVFEMPDVVGTVWGAA